MIKIFVVALVLVAVTACDSARYTVVESRCDQTAEYTVYHRENGYRLHLEVGNLEVPSVCEAVGLRHTRVRKVRLNMEVASIEEARRIVARERERYLAAFLSRQLTPPLQANQK